MPNDTIQVVGQFRLDATLRAITGLHIGGESGKAAIGGTDLPVVRDASGRPYVPGSSLKGKLRALLERHLGLDLVPVSDSPLIRIHGCTTPEKYRDCPVCLIFGLSTQEGQGKDVVAERQPGRLVVRDAPLAEEAPGKPHNLIEVKWENVLDRITSQAMPRQIERVAPGTRFRAEFLYKCYEDSDRRRFADFLRALQYLEHDYLGGQGSRGYGKVAFEGCRLTWWSSAALQRGDPGEVIVEGVDVRGLLEAHKRWESMGGSR